MLLKGLQEHTLYEVKDEEGNSESWQPLRRLREGDQTSPVLSNVYHATSMLTANKRREDENQNCGIEMQWTPGNSFPPKDTNKANGNSAGEAFRICDVLFADDTTLIGKKSELEIGRDIIVETLEKFEDICLPAKEERMELGSNTGIRVLGSYCNRKVDTAKRTERMMKASFLVKRRLVNSKLSKGTPAKVAEAIIEVTGLINCAIRLWSQAVTRRLRGTSDKKYRYNWSSKIELLLKEMTRTNTNMYGIRRTR